MRTKIAIVALIAIILVTARISCVTKFLNQLGKEGRLPEFSTNEHGMFASKVVEISYPYTLTVQFVKTGDKSRCNYYTIVQPKKDSEWQLKRAWQTDATGKIVEEWTVE